MQSIFRPASRREMLGEHAGGGRRDGGLKMGWTKRSGMWRKLWVSIAGSISDEDLKRPELMSVWTLRMDRDASSELSWCRGMRSVPEKIFAMIRVATPHLSLGPAKLARNHLLCI